MSINKINQNVIDGLSDTIRSEIGKTNCITSVPQNIILELNDGTLTLKAGSKVYVPNGAGVFDEVVIQSDLSATFDNTLQKCLFVNSTGTGLFHCNVETQTASGSVEPSFDYGYWYDTELNTIKRTIDGTSFTGSYSFPVCLATGTNGSVTSIDKVFNDFGYIGNTMFSLQSLKGLIPNGRNADKTLNNVEFETTGVLTHTLTSGQDGYIVLNGTVLAGWNVNNSRYDFENNINLYNGVKNNVAIVGTVLADSTGRITSFNPKLPFQAVDYNEFNTLPKHVVVSVLPADPDPNTFYYIPE